MLKSLSHALLDYDASLTRLSGKLAMARMGGIWSRTDGIACAPRHDRAAFLPEAGNRCKIYGKTGLSGRVVMSRDSDMR